LSAENINYTKRTAKPLTVIAIISSSIFFGTAIQAANQDTVDLGTASTYAVLAGTTVTNTGATIFSGGAGSNLGLSPGTSITGESTIAKAGTTNIANPAAVKAQEDLVDAYNDAAGRTLTGTVSADLGGQTLLTGTYNSASSLGLTGTLTLDAEGDPNAVWVFQAGSTLTTASSSSVSLINDAQACNVFWQVGSSATLGTNSILVGHVMALTSITATTGATIQGSLLARNGAVTLDTNTIINAPFTAATATPTATPTPTPTATESAIPATSACATESATPTPSTTTTPTAIATPAVTTTTGGKLPDTGAEFAALAAGGLALVAAGVAALRIRKRRD
jgi:LPXTG-motif cell wall-anchored protein